MTSVEATDPDWIMKEDLSSHQSNEGEIKTKHHSFTNALTHTLTPAKIKQMYKVFDTVFSDSFCREKG